MFLITFDLDEKADSKAAWERIREFGFDNHCQDKPLPMSTAYGRPVPINAFPTSAALVRQALLNKLKGIPVTRLCVAEVQDLGPEPNIAT